MAHKIKINWMHIYLYFCLSIIFIGLGLICYWEFYPYNVVSFNKPYETVQKIYKRGESLTLDVDITQHMSGVHVTVYRAFTDDITFNLTDNPQYITKLGDFKTVNATNIIPVELPVGIYRYRSTSVYHVNPIRDVIITRTTNEFTVK